MAPAYHVMTQFPFYFLAGEKGKKSDCKKGTRPAGGVRSLVTRPTPQAFAYHTLDYRGSLGLWIRTKPR